MNFDAASSDVIKYVREKQIAPLLNDMIRVLVETHPSDPIAALVHYLERCPTQQQPQRSPSKTVTAAQHRARGDSAAGRS